LRGILLVKVQQKKNDTGKMFIEVNIIVGAEGVKPNRAGNPV